MKKVALIPLIALAACADSGPIDDDQLIENATLVAALSEGTDDENLDQVPDGDVEEAAEEEANLADGEDEIVRDCSLRAIRRHVIATYDEDGDGELGDDEREQLREDFGDRPRRRARMAKHRRFKRLRWIYDNNNDGELDEDERAELRADLETRCENRQVVLLERFDEDDDGTLSDDEWTAAREWLAQRRADRRAAVIDEYDTNDNGELDRVEREAFRAQRRADFADRRSRIVREFDVDGDGTLSDEEKEALREALKARVRGDHFGDDAEDDNQD